VSAEFFRRDRRQAALRLSPQTRACRQFVATGIPIVHTHRYAAGGVGDLLEHALFALNGQRPHEAERIARDILKRDARNARALQIFGVALLMQGRAEDAVAPLESAAGSRRDAEIETQLAVALRQSGRHGEALPPLKRAVKQRPPYPPAFRELGALLFSREQYDEAIAVLKRGVEAAPMMADLSIQLGYVMLQINDCAGAKAAFARALQIAPGDADALFGIAKAFRGAGEARPAAEYFRRYLVSAPGDQSAWLYLGHCLLEIGEIDAGYDCFRTAARGDRKRYGRALASLAASRRGRFWFRPSAAARFMQAAKS
jgi:tetratricopeptide (TPR) repeat protein